jgi:hypothetical protein
MSNRDRAFERAKRLHMLLGGNGDLLKDLPLKRPPSMRRSTYAIKYRQYCEALALAAKLTRAAMEKMFPPTVYTTKGVGSGSQLPGA